MVGLHYILNHKTGFLNNKANQSDLQTTNSNLSTLSSTVDNKVDKITGKGLSTEDFTTTLKNKLDDIEAQANKTVVDSALSSTSENPLQNKAINTALGGKAPTSHASTNGNYGLGNATMYGHVKTINKLSTSSYVNGESLSAYQGKVLNDTINTKQDKLVSGSNIKTINNQSLLGSGNISISGGGNVDDYLDTSSTNPVQNQAIANAFEKIVEDLDNVSSYYGTLFRLSDVYDTNELVGFGDFLVYSVDANALFYAKTGNMNEDEIATMGDIPSLTNYVQKSSTTGLLKNNGTVDTTTYATQTALNNKEDKIEDTGWKNVTYNSGYTDYDSANKLQYRRIGKLVEVRGIMKVTATKSGTSHNIASISDTTCRPNRTVRVYNTGFTNYHFVTTVDNVGNIIIDRMYSGNTSQSSMTTSMMFNIQMSFFVE